MSNNNALQYNRVYAPIIIGITIILGLFVLRPFYTDYLSAETQIVTAKATEATKQKKLQEILAVKSSFSASGNTLLAEKAKKLNNKWDTTTIMQTVMINEFTKSNGITPATININSIAVDRGTKLPNGLSMGSVNISLSANSVDNLLDFLTYLTQHTDNYAFIIDNISLPIDTAPDDDSSQGAVSLALTLGVYYYE